MKKFFLQGSILIITLLCILTACNHNDELLKECASKTGTSADFTFESSRTLRPDSARVQKDTFRAGSWVRFTAKDNKAYSYKWIIGDDPKVWDGREISVLFDEPVGKVPVKLMVDKEVNKVCFPKDTGKDAITKMIKIVDPEIPFMGKFRGAYIESPNEQFEVMIDKSPYYPQINGEPIQQQNNYYSYTLTGLPYPATEWTKPILIGVRDNDFYIEPVKANGDAFRPYPGRMVLSSEIQYEISDPRYETPKPYGYWVEAENKLVVRLVQCVDNNEKNCVTKTFVGYRIK